MQPLASRKTSEARSFSLIKTILCFCFAPAIPSRHRGTHFRDGGRAESFRLFPTHTLKGKAPEWVGNLVLLGGIWYKTRHDAAFHRSVLARRDPSSDLSQRGRSGCRHLGKVGKIGFLAWFIFRRFFFFRVILFSVWIDSSASGRSPGLPPLFCTRIAFCSKDCTSFPRE